MKRFMTELHEAPLEKDTRLRGMLCVVTLWVVWRLNIVLHYSSDEIYRVRSDLEAYSFFIFFIKK